MAFIATIVGGATHRVASASPYLCIWLLYDRDLVLHGDEVSIKEVDGERVWRYRPTLCRTKANQPYTRMVPIGHRGRRERV